VEYSAPPKRPKRILKILAFISLLFVVVFSSFYVLINPSKFKLGNYIKYFDKTSTSVSVDSDSPNEVSFGALRDDQESSGEKIFLSEEEFEKAIIPRPGIIRLNCEGCDPSINMVTGHVVKKEGNEITLRLDQGDFSFLIPPSLSLYSKPLYSSLEDYFKSEDLTSEKIKSLSLEGILLGGLVQVVGKLDGSSLRDVVYFIYYEDASLF